LILLVAALLIGVHDAVTLKTALEGVRDALYPLVQIIALLLLLGVLALLFGWASGQGDGALTLAFENATGDASYDGQAISDLLLVALQRIWRIHNLGDLVGCPEDSQIGLPSLQASMPAQKLKLPALQCKGDTLNDSITDIGTISVGDSQVPVGRLLLTLKRLWPTGRRDNVLAGSLQKYGQELRLAARTKAKDGLHVWEVAGSAGAGEKLPQLIQDLAYQVAFELSSTTTAKTWLAFKYFTEARESYGRYSLTRQVEDLDETRAACEAVLAIDPEFWPLHRLAGYIGAGYMRLGQFETAVSLLRSSLKLEQGGAELFLALSPAQADWLLRLRGSYPDVIDRLQRPDAGWRSGIKPDDAQQLAQIKADQAPRLQALHAHCAQILLALGWAQLLQGELPAASATYRQAVALDPANADAHIQLTVTDLQLGRRAQAVRTLVQTARLQPHNPTLIPKLGWLYAVLGRAEQAIEAYQQWAQQLSADFAPQWDLALINMDFGRLPEALAAAQNAISLNAQSAVPHLILAYVYWNQGRSAEVLPEIRRASELGPDQFLVHAILAAYCQQFGRPAEYQVEVIIARQFIDQADGYARACFEVVCGNPDAALTLLQEQLFWLRVTPERIRVDPTLRPIQGDPRLHALLDEFQRNYRGDLPA
jgi:tetratricopeptide (TPR) repeat protein